MTAQHGAVVCSIAFCQFILGLSRVASSISTRSAYVDDAGLRGSSSHIDPGAYKFRMGAVPV
jgi:hypothetical protein